MRRRIRCTGISTSLTSKREWGRKGKLERTPTVTITNANHSFAPSLSIISPSSPIPPVFPIKLGIFVESGSLASNAWLSAVLS